FSRDSEIAGSAGAAWLGVPPHLFSTSGALLIREHDDLFGTDPLGIHIGDDLEAGPFHLTQAKVCHLETLAFSGCDRQTGLIEHPGGLLNRLPIFLPRNHRTASPA